MTSQTPDVAIVGYGPVGALCALLLAEAGLRVSIVERSVEPVVLPRAVGLDGESVRAFQRVGLENEITAILQPPREGDQVAFTNSKREPYFAMDMPATGANGWRDMSMFDQPELEALLRDLVAARDRIEVSLGAEVTGLEQDADGVTLRIASASGEHGDLRAPYVIGCDGASSFVREAIAVDWESLGYDQDWLVVDIVQGPDADLPIQTMQVCDPARLTTYVCVKDPNRRWEFQLLPSETREEMVRPERIRGLLDSWLPSEQYEIRRAAVYQFHAANAERWNVGRVFLAGDAAHQTPPFLGQGLNAGFRDAVNLGWKLPLVFEGVCDPILLETYGAERDAHARDLVEWAVAIGKLMETLAAREAGLPDPHEATDMASGYGQGRTVPPLRGGALVMEQAERGRPVGSMLRQPRVRTPEGDECWIDELFGPGFCVIGRKAGDLEMGERARAVLSALGGRTCALEGLELVEGESDVAFETHPALVLRPDRYIFGVVDDAWDLDRLLAELGRLLGLR